MPSSESQSNKCSNSEIEREIQVQKDFDIILVRTERKRGILDLVDLAGSERLRVSNAKGARLEECKHINQSLSALSKVIGSLSENPKRKHVSYRDSKLTRLLKKSLGGNSKTSLIACVSPSHDSLSETLSTLHFACKAKLVRNQIIKNCQIRKVVNLNQPEREYRETLKNQQKLQIVEEEDQADFMTKKEMQQYSERKYYESTHLSSENQFQSNQRKASPDYKDENGKINKLEKKNKNLKEKLKICEREREIALNALQQQTEHFSREKDKRKQLQEKVDHLEMMLEIAHSRQKDLEGIT